MERGIRKFDFGFDGPFDQYISALRFHQCIGVLLGGVGGFFGRSRLQSHLLQRIDGSSGGDHGSHGLDLNFLEGLEPNVYATDSDYYQSDTRKYLWPIIRLVLGLVCCVTVVG